MAIKILLDDLLKEKKISLTELSEDIGISIVNLSRLKTNNVKAIRFSTLNKLCKRLDCQPTDIFAYIPDEE